MFYNHHKNNYIIYNIKWIEWIFDKFHVERVSTHTFCALNILEFACDVWTTKRRARSSSLPSFIPINLQCVCVYISYSSQNHTNFLLLKQQHLRYEMLRYSELAIIRMLDIQCCALNIVIDAWFFAWDHSSIEVLNLNYLTLFFCNHAHTNT